jgi:hypothetical protein
MPLITHCSLLGSATSPVGGYASPASPDRTNLGPGTAASVPKESVDVVAQNLIAFADKLGTGRRSAGFPFERDSARRGTSGHASLRSSTK